MSAKHCTDAELLEAVEKHGKAGAARALGLNERRIYARLAAITGRTGEVPKHTNTHELQTLRAQVRRLADQVLTDDRIKREVIKVADAPVHEPAWLVKPAKGGKSRLGTPTLFASDWHFGEVVNSAEIGGVNEYNMKIGRERAQTFIRVSIDLLRNHMKGIEYPGVVFALGGDMVSGDIHEELAQTNEVETMPVVLELLGVLSRCITELADEFGRVFVPCVTGNHGRTSRKPRAKRRNHTNFDWLLYQLLSRRFEGDKRVTFLIPEGPDAYYKVFGTRYLLTHGDQFRGGDGMIGALGPISRGDKKKRARNGQTERSFDVMMLGHWHQYIHLSRFITNGTLKGYDEYADANNFDVEPAQQALWITDPDHGITFRMPVFVQRAAKAERTEWVSVAKAA